MTHNVMLLECSSPFWIEVVRKLVKLNGLNPAYWVAWDRIKTQIEGVFPNTKFHDTANAKRNIFHDDFIDFQNAAFTNICQEIWLEEAQIVYDMLNRFDHARDFSFLQRQQYFYQSLIYWNAVIDDLKIDFIIFPNPPHVVYDYIVLALCRKKKIKTIMFDEATIFPPYCFSMPDFVNNDANIPSLNKRFSSSSKDNNTRQFKDSTISKIIDTIRSTYNDAKPIREVIAHKTLKKRSFKDKYGEYMELLLYCIACLKNIKGKSSKSEINSGSVIKERNKELAASYTTSFQRVKFALQLIKEKNLSEKRYDHYHKLCKAPNLSKKYIYLSFAGQPERTSNPQGGIFTYQLIIANIIVNCLPKGWELYIKEHPNQFHPLMYVNMYRNEEFYSLLSSNPKIRLVPTNYDPFVLIDNSQIVATIAGTTGIEGLLRGKPALIFGEAWYRNCPGAFRVENFMQCKKAIQAIIKGVKINDTEIQKFLHQLIKSAFKGIGDPIPDNYGITTEENIDALTKRILQAIELN